MIMGRTMRRIPWEDYIEILEDLQAKQRWLDLVIWTLYGHTGYRLQELRTLKWEDIKEDNIVITTTKTVRFGEHKRVRKAWLHDRVLGAISAAKPFLNRYNLPDLPVLRKPFHPSRNRAVSTTYISRRIKDICKEYDIPGWEDMATHSLRKTFAYRVYEIYKEKEGSAYALEVCRDILGHTQTKTTMVYLGLDNELRKNAFLSL